MPIIPVRRLSFCRCPLIMMACWKLQWNATSHPSVNKNFSHHSIRGYLERLLYKPHELSTVCDCPCVTLVSPLHMFDITGPERQEHHTDAPFGWQMCPINPNFTWVFDFQSHVTKHLVAFRSYGLVKFGMESYKTCTKASYS